MKLPAFRYEAPATLAEALQLLADGGGAAKALAGGQSLIPVLAFRLALPGLVVDLRRLPGLDRIQTDADGVRLGARVRWCDIERDKRLASAHPLLAAAIAHVAHYPIRNRGTVGGSLAHADPAAELPGIAVSCDALLDLVAVSGTRTVQAGEFFTGALSTVLRHDELILQLRFPAWPAERRWAFEEFAMRRGDFALAGVALWYDTDAAGCCTHAHVGVIGACTRPQRIAAAEAALDGRRVDEGAIRAATTALAAALEPPADLHAGADYRRALAAILLERALRRAAA
jgi:carbon-monoxide dehydrogenase medium subunit